MTARVISASGKGVDIIVCDLPRACYIRQAYFDLFKYPKYRQFTKSKK
jgi:hypothetical protein